MSTKPLLLDGCSKAGGAATGYKRAGFDVLCVDIETQPNNPFWFHQADIREFIAKHGKEFDAIHVSPPCQNYTTAAQQWRKSGKQYPDLIADIRALLVEAGRPYVIENVKNAPLLNPTMLTSAHFGVMVARDRYYETSFRMPFELMRQHSKKPVKMGRAVSEGDVVYPVGHFSGAEYVRRQMGFYWMTQDELREAIPWQHTEYIGRYLLAEIMQEAA